jgi:hypothetical protein
MLRGPDLNSWKSTFDFAAAARQEQIAFSYNKLGGNNIANAAGTRVPYVSGSYPSLTARTHAVGWRAGHYWVTGGTDIVGSARFFLANLYDFRLGFDFAVLDNETLDDGRTWTDAECAVWWDIVGPSTKLNFQYSSKDNFSALPLTLARGVKIISADYNGIEDVVSAIPSNIPADKVVGHQFSDNYNIGGLSVDYNVFTDDAFDFADSAPVKPPLKRKVKRMDYGLVKGDGNASVYAIRLSDGAAKGIGYPLYAAFLSAGYTLSIVPQGDLDTYVKTAPSWQPTPAPSAPLA